MNGFEPILQFNCERSRKTWFWYNLEAKTCKWTRIFVWCQFSQLLFLIQFKESSFFFAQQQNLLWDWMIPNLMVWSKFTTKRTRADLCLLLTEYWFSSILSIYKTNKQTNPLFWYSCVITFFAGSQNQLGASTGGHGRSPPRRRRRIGSTRPEDQWLVVRRRTATWMDLVLGLEEKRKEWWYFQGSLSRFPTKRRKKISWPWKGVSFPKGLRRGPSTYKNACL